jgi:autotransporter-associated beta strand protein
LIFDSSASPAALNHDSGTFSIAADVQLRSTLVVTGAPASGSVSPQFSGIVSEVGSQSISLLNSSASLTEIRHQFTRANSFSGGVSAGPGISLRPGISGALGTGPVTLRGTAGALASAVLAPTASMVLVNPILFDGSTPFSNFTNQINLPTVGIAVTLAGPLSGHVNTASPGISLNGGTLRLGGTLPNTWTTGGNLRLATGGTLILEKESALPVSGGGVDFRAAASLLLNVATTLTSSVTIGSALAAGDITLGTAPGFTGTATFASATALNLNNLTTGGLLLTADGTGRASFSTLITDGTNPKSVTKTGSGTVALTRAAGHTYDGSTTVAAGTLLAANTSGSATGTGGVTIAPGASLGGTGIVSGPVTLQSGGKLSFTLGQDPASHDSLALGSTLALGGSPGLTVTFSGGSPAPGLYTLLTASGGITGTLPIPVVPAGYAASLSLSGGSSLILQLSLHLSVTAGLADSDGDGLTDAQEFVFGSDPLTSGIAPVLEMATTGNGLTLTFVAKEALGINYTGLTRYYTVETSATLTNASWLDLPGYSRIAGAGQALVIALPANGTARFYRLKVILE